MADYLERSRTINTEYYANILDQWKRKIKEERPGLVKVLYHQDNALSHKAGRMMAKLHEACRVHPIRQTVSSQNSKNSLLAKSMRLIPKASHRRKRILQTWTKVLTKNRSKSRGSVVCLQRNRNFAFSLSAWKLFIPGDYVSRLATIPNLKKHPLSSDE